MKGKKLLAVVLVTLMIASSVSFTAFATASSIDWSSQPTATVAVKEIVSSEDYGFYTTLAEALTAIQNDNGAKDLYEIECKPGANVGTLLHSTVTDNIIINGNGAYISNDEGEHDIAFEQLNDDANKLTKDINVTVNKLNGISAWGRRYTGYTINLEFIECKHMDRIYITEDSSVPMASGVNNITLKKCSFDTELGKCGDTGVYSCYAGTITVEDCDFKDIPVPINLNNKSDGAQNVDVKNCTFKNVAPTTNDASYAAPIRFVTSGEGTTNATVSDCSFENVTTANGDILIGDGRTGKTSNANVTAEIKSTEAEVQVQSPDKPAQVVDVEATSESTTIDMSKRLSAIDTTAENVTVYNEEQFRAAVATSSSATTITLGGNIAINHNNSTGLTIWLSKNCTIDLAGYTLDLTNLVQINSAANVTITGIENKAKIKYSRIATTSVFEVSGGTLNVSNIEFVFVGDGAVCYLFQLQGGEALKIDSCKILNVSAEYGVVCANNTDDGNVTIKNSEISASGEAIFGGNQTITDSVIKGNPAIKVVRASQTVTLNGQTTVTGGVDKRGGATIVNNVPGLNLETAKTDRAADGKTYYYASLAEAVQYAKDGDIVTLLRDASGDGMVIDKDFSQNGLTIDLNNHTYTISGKAVGSFGSYTNGFQLKKYEDADLNTYTNNITIKNGTLTSTETAECVNNGRGQHNRLSILIQNYSNLTLDNVTLDGSELLHDDEWTPFTLSNCNGNVKIIKSTITAQNAFAFDVDNKPGYDGVTVTIDEESVVDGFVRIDRNSDTSSTAAILKIGDLSYSVNADYLKVGAKFVMINKTDVDARSIEVTAAPATVKAGEEVTVTVKLKGSDLAYASYELSYDKALFDLENEDGDINENDGIISFEAQSGIDGTGNAIVFDCGEDGYTLAQYTFIARAQTSSVIGNFTLNETIARTHEESRQGLYDVKVKNNDKASVTINLSTYTARVKVDGAEVAETSKRIPYDGKGHSVSVEVTPKDYKKITYTYTKDGNGITEPDSFKEMGEYTITYTVVSDSYEDLTGTFTLVIEAPTAYIVEVNTDEATPQTKDADYVAGKKLVLVYTDLDGVAFKYDGKLMINVSKTHNEYQYDKTHGSDTETAQTDFKYVYAYVADIDDNVTLTDYKANITPYVINGQNVPSLKKYDEDINLNGGFDTGDTTTAYGVWGVFSGYFTFSSPDDSTSKQLNILKADVNGDKCVNGQDVQRVDLAVRNNDR